MRTILSTIAIAAGLAGVVVAAAPAEARPYGYHHRYDHRGWHHREDRRDHHRYDHNRYDHHRDDHHRGYRR